MKRKGSGACPLVKGGFDLAEGGAGAFHCNRVGGDKCKLGMEVEPLKASGKCAFGGFQCVILHSGAFGVVRAKEDGGNNFHRVIGENFSHPGNRVLERRFKGPDVAVRVRDRPVAALLGKGPSENPSRVCGGKGGSVAGVDCARVHSVRLCGIQGRRRTWRALR